MTREIKNKKMWNTREERGNGTNCGIKKSEYKQEMR